MTAELTYNQVIALLPAYVLGALEPDEILAIDAYIQAHPALLARLRELESTLEQLPYAVPDAPLPPDARSQLLERVRADLGAHPTRAAGAPATPPPEALMQPPPPLRTRQPVRWHAHLVRWWTRGGIPGALISGALAALLLISLYAIQLHQHLNTYTTQIADLQNQVEQLSLQTQDQRRLLALVTDPEKRVPLAGTATAPEARGTFYERADAGVLVAQGLPPLNHQQTYQLWLIADGAPLSAGLLPPGTPDTPTILSVARLPVQDFAGVAISVEPVGGSPSPTGPIVLQSSPN